jgi:hypothetical protein
MVTDGTRIILIILLGVIILHARFIVLFVLPQRRKDYNVEAHIAP